MKLSKRFLERALLAFALWLLLVTALVSVVVLPPAVSTVLGLAHLHSGNTTQAQRWWTGAYRSVSNLDSLLQQRVAVISSWSQLLKLGVMATEKLTSSETKSWGVAALPSITLDLLPQLRLTVASLQSTSEKCPLFNLLMPSSWESQLGNMEKLLLALEPIVSRDSTWLILLQNANELRASGGFMGSYALIRLAPNQPISITVEDIYDADGQFTGFVQAPPGVSEYLSGGKGMRLPDANWSSDFALSANQILAYFALGQKQYIDGVIAINHPVIASVLQIVGPVILPDYNLVLTSDTIDAVLHQRPNQFFPGSIQKKHMLQQAQSALLTALGQLRSAEYRAIITALKRHVAQNNILMYSPHPDLQALLSEWGVSGELPPLTPDTDVLALVESNVGINKINQWVSREVAITQSDADLELTITFRNHSPEDRYLNYQRIITAPDWLLTSVHGDVVDSAHSVSTTTFTAPNGSEYAETGFLVSVPSNSQRLVRTTWQLESPKKPNLLLVKQPGLSATPIMLLTDALQKKLILESNRTIEW